MSFTVERALRRHHKKTRAAMKDEEDAKQRLISLLEIGRAHV